MDAPLSVDLLRTSRPRSQGLVHTTHAAHAGVAGGHRGFGFLDVAEDALGGEEHAGDAGGVLQGHAGHLGGVDDTALEQVRSTSVAGHTSLIKLGRHTT